MSVRQYLLHGVRLETRAESAALREALANRLRFFATEATGAPDCRFDFRLVTSEELAQAGALADASGQLLVEEGEARIIYHKPTDAMYLSFRDGLIAVIYGSSSRAEILVPEDAVESIRRLKHAVFMLPLIELLRPHGLYNTHAAGLAVNGKGLLFPAECGSGKTTLTLTLARGGFEFLSDDLIFLKQDGQQVSMHAFPDDVDLTEDTRRIFPELEPHLRPEIPGCPKRQVSPAQAYGARIAAECAPAAVICPRVAHTDHTRLERLSSLEAFPEFAQNVTLARPKAAQKHLNIIGALLRQVPCYRMHTGRDLDVLPDLLRELLS